MQEAPALIRSLLTALEIESVGKRHPCWIPLATVHKRMGDPDGREVQAAIEFAHGNGWLSVTAFPVYTIAITARGALEARGKKK